MVISYSVEEKKNYKLTLKIEFATPKNRRGLTAPAQVTQMI